MDKAILVAFTFLLLPFYPPRTLSCLKWEEEQSSALFRQKLVAWCEAGSRSAPVTGGAEEGRGEATMLEIRSTKYARQLNLTFFGKRYEDVPDGLRLGWREGEGTKNASMSARPLPLTCHKLS